VGLKHLTIITDLTICLESPPLLSGAKRLSPSVCTKHPRPALNLQSMALGRQYCETELKSTEYRGYKDTVTLEQNVQTLSGSRGIVLLFL